MLSANLIFGDGIFVNLIEFDMIVLANGTVDSLSYRFASLSTPTVADGTIILNSPLYISGTDIASANPFSYTYADSSETFTPSSTSVPGLSTLGLACVSLLVFSTGIWLLARIAPNRGA